ncbi:other/FunK1 protein kinase [Coprinopsis cinerea AmutBmut pab1-1]|nr:other/FunK1 protein kinase [Coprinopsis cinerea AmutBmut pab1-1]
MRLCSFRRLACEARTTLVSKCIADDDMFLESLPPSLESLVVPLELENPRNDLYSAYTSRNREDRINDMETCSYIMGRAFTLFFMRSTALMGVGRAGRRT